PANPISGRARRRFSHEQNFLAARRNPGRDVRAVQVDIGGAARRVRQQHRGHAVLSGNDGRGHGIRYLWTSTRFRQSLAPGWLPVGTSWRWLVLEYVAIDLDVFLQIG